MKVMRCKKLGFREVPRSCHVLNGRKDYCKDLFVTDEKDVDLELNSFDATVCKIGSTYLKEMDKDAIAKVLEPYKDGDKVKVIIKSKGE